MPRLEDDAKRFMAQKIADLLRETEQAHAVHERVVLHGKRDENWADWYATYMVDKMTSPKLEYV